MDGTGAFRGTVRSSSNLRHSSSDLLRESSSGTAEAIGGEVAGYAGPTPYGVAAAAIGMPPTREERAKPSDGLSMSRPLASHVSGDVLKSRG